VLEIIVLHVNSAQSLLHNSRVDNVLVSSASELNQTLFQMLWMPVWQIVLHAHLYLIVGWFEICAVHRQKSGEIEFGVVLCRSLSVSQVRLAGRQAHCAAACLQITTRLQP